MQTESIQPGQYRNNWFLFQLRRAVQRKSLATGARPNRNAGNDSGVGVVMASS
jgi:hypothetical protein